LSAIHRFLGDSPLRVLIKLIVVSFLVGLLLTSMGWTPWDVVRAARDLVVNLWETGFEALGKAGDYLIVGAVIVVPLFLLLRLLSWRR
jgi:hypothetical protein